MRGFRATEDAIANVLGKANSYREIFKSPAGRRVLYDLSQRCGAASTTYHEDAREQARLEGRRQIWLEIQQFLRLTQADIDDLIAEGKKHYG